MAKAVKRRNENFFRERLLYFAAAFASAAQLCDATPASRIKPFSQAFELELVTMATILEEITELKTLPNSSPSKVTFEEYLEWDSESGYVEWVDGEIEIMPNPSLKHQEIVGFLHFLLKAHNAKHTLGKIIQAPFAMKLEAIARGREPDILFVAKERESLFEKNYFNGAADVAVEVISPGSGRKDRGDKYFEYEVSGIKEYWLIDPERQHAEFYRLGEDKLYHTVSLEADKIFRSETITGFWFPVNWLWNIPNELEALREVGLI
jgi:Uma2 family endonuclease